MIRIPLLQGPVVLGFSPLFLRSEAANRLPACRRPERLRQGDPGVASGLDTLGALLC